MTRVEPAGSFVGHLAVPGDKSISHRAVLIGALAEGETHVVLIEPKTTLNTGNVHNERTIEELDRI